jgi:hypothetical protein
MITIGLSREAFGGGLPHVRWQPGTVSAGDHPSGSLTVTAMPDAGRQFAHAAAPLCSGSGRLNEEADAAMGIDSGLRVIPLGGSRR